MGAHARTRQPHEESFSEKGLSEFPNVQVPEALLSDPEWRRLFARCLQHLKLNLALDAKRLNEPTVQMYVEQCAAHPMPRVLEVLEYSISYPKALKIYWDCAANSQSPARASPDAKPSKYSRANESARRVVEKAEKARAERERNEQRT